MEHICPRCGVKQHRGFRCFHRGIGYCDACVELPQTYWLIGPGYYGIPVFSRY